MGKKNGRGFLRGNCHLNEIGEATIRAYWEDQVLKKEEVGIVIRVEIALGRFSGVCRLSNNRKFLLIPVLFRSQLK